MILTTSTREPPLTPLFALTRPRSMRLYPPHAHLVSPHWRIRAAGRGALPGLLSALERDILCASAAIPPTSGVCVYISSFFLLADLSCNRVLSRPDAAERGKYSEFILASRIRRSYFRVLAARARASRVDPAPGRTTRRCGTAGLRTIPQIATSQATQDVGRREQRRVASAGRAAETGAGRGRHLVDPGGGTEPEADEQRRRGECGGPTWAGRYH